IRSFKNWEVISEQNHVSYNEVTDRALTEEDDYYRAVVMAGQLQSSWECGDTCYEMAYGDEGQYTVVIRTKSDFAEVGKCITYAGPMAGFPGPYDENEDLKFQIDAINFDWQHVPFDHD